MNAIHRRLYALAMLLGLRAGTNLLRSWLCRARLRTSVLAGVPIHSEELGRLTVAVHRRPSPNRSPEDVRYGMLSLRREHPNVNWLGYRYLLLTSHFGCGHVEVAFYEKGDVVTVYAIRNILRANAARLGLRRMAGELSLAEVDEPRKVLVAVLDALAKHGLAGRLASPSVCVALAVNRRLLDPRTEAETLGTLHRRYAKLQLASDSSIP